MTRSKKLACRHWPLPTSAAHLLILPMLACGAGGTPSDMPDADTHSSSSGTAGSRSDSAGSDSADSHGSGSASSSSDSGSLQSKGTGGAGDAATGADSCAGGDDAGFSATLTPYATQPTAQQTPIATILSHVTTPGAPLTATELQTRTSVLAMYTSVGIDPSLDYENDDSAVLAALSPASFAPPTKTYGNAPPSMLLSPDAPFYHSIPACSPRVALPVGYIREAQVNAVVGGDGIGFGEVVAAASDPLETITSEWPNDASTLKTFPFRMPTDWSSFLPWNTGGDMHLIYVDPTAATFCSSYKTSVGSLGPDALYASSPVLLNSLGTTGGSNTTNAADLPYMIQPGELTDAAQPIQHAIGGPVGRTWAARVFPASARDAGILTSVNTCTGTGYMNTGLVPYGGVIQLDPAVNLATLGLTLPALRLLEAMQTYGYYVMDFGCGDFDVYTAINESELLPYGGLYGNATHPGVQNEVQSVVGSHTLYVVPPLVKR